MKVVLFAGYSESGKTTAIAEITKALAKRGRRVGTIKHSGHAVLDLDAKGKDTWMHFNSGASVVVGMTSEQMAVFKKLNHPEAHVDEVLQMMEREGIEYVLVEGMYDEFSRRKGVPIVICAKAREDAAELLKRHGRALFITGRMAAGTDSEPMEGVPVIDLKKGTERALRLIG
jgi:molybdopterin-guanine dinucleotide biosynthesis protein MobB